MKKLTSIILTLGMILTLSACSDNTSSSMTDSGSSSDVSSAISSESEEELTFDEKFRGLDQELRYDEVIELLGEPDEKGGENVKYLSYKQDDGKSAIVQFLYGDNPRIDYTYITDLKAEEEEIILHRRICDHEKGYCSFDIHYSEEMRDFIEKAKTIKKGMNKDEVAEILGEPYDFYCGGFSGAIEYNPDDYHKLYIYTALYSPDEIEGNNGEFGVDMVYAWDRLVFGQTDIILHEGKEQGRIWVVRTESEQTAFEQKVTWIDPSVPTKKDIPLKDYLLDYIGEPDEEINDGDITKLVYKLSDGTFANLCILNSGAEPIIEFTYIYDPVTKEVSPQSEVVRGCDFEKYLPEDTVE